MKKASKEFMEREKNYWRTQATFEEEMGWERKLRADAHELVAFLETERRFQMAAQGKSATRREQEKQTGPTWEDLDVMMQEEEDMQQEQQQRQEPMQAREQRQQHQQHQQQQQQHHHHHHQQELLVPMGTIPRAHSASPQPPAPIFSRTHTPLPPPLTLETPPPTSSSPPLPTTAPATFPSHQESSPVDSAFADRPATPPNTTTTIPVHFNDSEDKENRTPVTLSHPHSHTRSISACESGTKTVPLAGAGVCAGVGTPIIDRAAALAAIQYRRGRAKSLLNHQVTPRKTPMLDRRDVSAPALVTMTVGRKK